MLPIVLVLFVATSAFAAPSVSLTLQPIQETAYPYDSGVGVTGGLISQLLELIDGGDTNVNIIYLNQVIQDLAGLSDTRSQALAASQIIAVLGELAYGVPGDACSAAQAINQYVSNGGGASFLSTLASNMDAITALGSNPNSIRYSVPPSGNCNGSGRTYQFEAVWSSVLKQASPLNIGLVNEEYCSAKRLYNALSVRSNNVAAAVTAASLPPVLDVVERNITPILYFLRAVLSGNGSAYAASAKAALS